MLTMILIGAAISIGTGLTLKFVGPRFGDYYKINTHELVVGTLACSIVIIPLVTGIGFSVAKSSALKYYEFYNGVETSATVDKTTCTRDGSCEHTYSCDPYTVFVTKTRTVSDGKGGTRTESYTDTETRYHDCPYATEEFDYYVADSLGDSHHIGGTRFADHPKRWRNRTLPNVPRGKPDFWVAAKARLDAGNPGGVTKTASYDNYILASQRDIYAKHSNDINGYLKAGLMPKPAAEVVNYYEAAKFQSIGAVVKSPRQWDTAIARFNGTLGAERRGDLHMVVVDAAKIDRPDAYAQAVESYWQSPALGKHTLSKNGIVVLLGATDGKVAWARSFTGMPEGNETVVQNIQNLTGTGLTPAAIFGPTGVGKVAFAASVAPTVPTTTEPVAVVASKTGKVAKVVPVLPTPTPTAAVSPPATGGALEQIVLAKVGGYERIHMAQYTYLKDDIQPGSTAKTVIIIIGLALSITIWLGLLNIEFSIPLPAAWSAASPSPIQPNPRRTARSIREDLLSKYKS